MGKTKIWVPDPAVIKKLKKAIRESRNPDTPIMGTGRQSYSLNQILLEVEQGTAFGRKYQDASRRLDQRLATKAKRKTA